MRSGSEVRRRRAVCFGFALTALVAPAPSHAEESTEATEPRVRPTLPWLVVQLVPSPEVAVGEGTARFGLRWQVTPILYSWGIHRKLSPIRVLVAEPNVRHSGAIEAFLSPEVIFGAAQGSAAWLLRPGVRAYFPLLEHGETLSFSLGTSYQSIGGRESAAFEAGAYTLFGVVGVQVTYAPLPHQPANALFTFRIRYF